MQDFISQTNQTVAVRGIAASGKGCTAIKLADGYLIALFGQNAPMNWDIHLGQTVTAVGMAQAYFYVPTVLTLPDGSKSSIVPQVAIGWNLSLRVISINQMGQSAD